MRVALLSIGSCSSGVTLTAADTVTLTLTLTLTLILTPTLTPTLTLSLTLALTLSLTRCSSPSSLGTLRSCSRRKRVGG